MRTTGKHARPTRGSERAFTLIEIMVTLGILVIVMASVLSVFAAGTRMSMRAREKMEAGRVALAVFDMLEAGFNDQPDRTGTWYGRDGNGDFTFSGTIASHELPANYQYPPAPSNWSAWEPMWVIKSPVRLVWRCTISQPSGWDADEIKKGMHLVRVIVSRDEDNNNEFNLATDREVGRFYAVVSDRTVN